jgi:septum formation protein
VIALGSTSATRAKILLQEGVKFVQRGVDFDEGRVALKTPNDYVFEITKGKFEAYMKNYKLDMPFVVADTVVVAAGQILLKAKDEQEALKMLKLQSGRSVEIITCMIYKAKTLELCDISVTKYQFDKFDNKDMIKYLQSGEWQGKAGACMVEGFCKPYIKSVVGFESTAMGLSVERLLPFLEKNVC